MPWLTTTNLSYGFSFFEISATALCDTTWSTNINIYQLMLEWKLKNILNRVLQLLFPRRKPLSWRTGGTHRCGQSASASGASSSRTSAASASAARASSAATTPTATPPLWLRSSRPTSVVVWFDVWGNQLGWQTVCLFGQFQSTSTFNITQQLNMWCEVSSFMLMMRW